MHEVGQHRPAIPPRARLAIPTRTPDHVNALDGIRGLAIAVVLIHNASFVLHGGNTFATKLTSALTAFGWIGVQLFFVLSGFLITGILLAGRNTPHRFRTFYIRRTLRIFPLYYAFLIGAFLVVPMIAASPAWSALVRRNGIWFWLYLTNWTNTFGHSVPGLAHLWSLAVEEQFYLLWPLLVFTLPDRALLAVTAAVITLTPFVRFVLRQVGLPPVAAYEFTVARWDALAAGAILALLMTGDSGRKLLQRSMPAVAAGTVGVWLVFLMLNRGFHEDDLSVQVIGQTIVSVASASLIYYCVAPASAAARRLQRMVSNPSLRWLGVYSYAIYIFHYPIQKIGQDHLTQWVNAPASDWRLARLSLYVAGVAALSLIASQISWYLLERPCLNLKDRLAPRPPLALSGRS